MHYCSSAEGRSKMIYTYKYQGSVTHVTTFHFSNSVPFWSPLACTQGEDHPTSPGPTPTSAVPLKAGSAPSSAEPLPSYRILTSLLPLEWPPTSGVSLTSPTPLNQPSSAPPPAAPFLICYRALLVVHDGSVLASVLERLDESHQGCSVTFRQKCCLYQCLKARAAMQVTLSAVNAPNLPAHDSQSFDLFV